MSDQKTLYQMIVDGEERWYSLREAGTAYDSGHVPVDFGRWTLENGEPREMTAEDKRKISDFADEYSASK